MPLILDIKYKIYHIYYKCLQNVFREVKLDQPSYHSQHSSFCTNSKLQPSQYITHEGGLWYFLSNLGSLIPIVNVKWFTVCFNYLLYSYYVPLHLPLVDPTNEFYNCVFIPSDFMGQYFQFRTSSLYNLMF